MQQPGVPKNQLIQIEKNSDISLGPALWLAVGVVAYNHALLAQKPIRIVSPEALVVALEPGRLESLRRGQAVFVEVTALSATSLMAVQKISRALLEPLNFRVSLHGGQHTRKYLLLEQTAGIVGIAMPEPEVSKAS